MARSGENQPEKCLEAKFPLAAAVESHGSRAHFTLWVHPPDCESPNEAAGYGIFLLKPNGVSLAASHSCGTPSSPVPLQAGWSGRPHPLLTCLWFPFRASSAVPLLPRIPGKVPSTLNWMGNLRAVLR